MRIGDYVRTKNFGIRKTNGFSSTLEEDFIDCDYDKYQNVLINKKDIIKSSSNIIDLIEVGDYANGKEVINCKEKWIQLYDKRTINDDEIKSIITKEQFESIEYKL